MQSHSEDRETPSWIIYERCVASMATEKFGSSEVVIQPNAPIRGTISGEIRQVDVLVDARYPDLGSNRTIIDAKQRSAKVDINDVESFEGMMRDCDAKRGVIVCTAGYTVGARKRSEDAITITILTMEEALQFDWDFEPCLGECRKGSQLGHRGMVLWDGPVTPAWADRPAMVLRVGKCDGCHQFHVECWSCGKKFIVPDAEMVACGCCNWTSVPEATDSEEADRTPESIWLMMLVEEMAIMVDRRPIHPPSYPGK